MIKTLLLKIVEDLAYKLAKEVSRRVKIAFAAYKRKSETPEEWKKRILQEELAWYSSKGQNVPPSVFGVSEWHPSNEDDHRIEEAIQKELIKVIFPPKN